MLASFQIVVVSALFIVAGLSLLNKKTARISLVMILAWMCQEVIVRYHLGGPLWPFGGSFNASPNATIQDFAPWKWFLAVNALAAFSILVPPHSRISALIGGVFIIQMLLDIGYGLADNSKMVPSYLNLQTNLLWLQIVLLGAFTGGHFIRLAWDYYHPAVDKVGSESVAR